MRGCDIAKWLSPTQPVSQAEDEIIQCGERVGSGNSLRELKEQMEYLYPAQILRGTFMVRSMYGVQFRSL